MKLKDLKALIIESITMSFISFIQSKQIRKIIKNTLKEVMQETMVEELKKYNFTNESTNKSPNGVIDNIKDGKYIIRKNTSLNMNLSSLNETKNIQKPITAIQQPIAPKKISNDSGVNNILSQMMCDPEVLNNPILSGD